MNLDKHIIKMNSKIELSKLAAQLNVSTLKLQVLMTKMEIPFKYFSHSVDIKTANKIEWFFKRLECPSKNGKDIGTLKENCSVIPKTGDKLTVHSGRCTGEVRPPDIDSRIFFYPKVCLKKFVIDGSNVCRSYPQEDNQFDLDVLLTLIVEINCCGGYFVCIFDANVEHIIKKLSPDNLICYQTIKKQTNIFAKVTGGISADEFILKRADTVNAKVISNDKFDNNINYNGKTKKSYLEKYKWIVDEPERLIKGNAIDGSIIIPDLDIDTKIIRNKEIITNLLINR